MHNPFRGVATEFSRGKVTSVQIDKAVQERLDNIELARVNGEKARKTIAARQAEIKEARGR